MHLCEELPRGEQQVVTYHSTLFQHPMADTCRGRMLQAGADLRNGQPRESKGTQDGVLTAQPITKRLVNRPLDDKCRLCALHNRDVRRRTPGIRLERRTGLVTARISTGRSSLVRVGCCIALEITV
jgi:hypothetical protein